MNQMMWRRRMGLAAVGLFLGGLAGPLPAAESVWEVLPYRVRLVAAVAPAADWPADMGHSLTQSLAARCASLIGPLWEIQTEHPPPDLARKMIADLDQLQGADIPADWQEGDKVLFVAVRPKGQGYQVQAREWDVRTQWFGSSVSMDLAQPAKLAQTALNAATSAFCPLARIDRPKEGRAVLRPRGLSLPRPPGGPQWIQPGVLFRPVVRKNDREGHPLSIKPIPWTYLLVQQVRQEGVDCRIYSGFSGAISERRRGRIEMLALAVRPPQKATVLCLADRNTPDQPLAGYEVWAHTPGQRQVVSLGRSNLRGEVFVPPSPQGLQVLIIASGGTPLARAPVVPGLETRLQVLLPRDAPRLAAEGFVRGMEEALVDWVGQREIFLARFQRRLQQGRTEEAAQWLDQLEDLRRQREWLAQQLSEQEKIITSPDPELRSKIQTLWTRARQLLAQHADDRILRDLASQLLQAKTSPQPTVPPSAPKP